MHHILKTIKHIQIYQGSLQTGFPNQHPDCYFQVLKQGLLLNLMEMLVNWLLNKPHFAEKPKEVNSSIHQVTSCHKILCLNGEFQAPTGFQ